MNTSPRKLFKKVESENSLRAEHSASALWCRWAESEILNRSGYSVQRAFDIAGFGFETELVILFQHEIFPERHFCGRRTVMQTVRSKDDKGNMVKIVFFMKYDNGGYIRRAVEWPAVPHKNDRVYVADRWELFTVDYVEWTKDGSAVVHFTEKISSNQADLLVESKNDWH